jgi:serine/threonine protein kinase
MNDGVRGEHKVSIAEYADRAVDLLTWNEPGGIEALDILGEQLYQGIREFSREGFVHLDIKGANILLQGEGAGWPGCVRTGNCHFMQADLDHVGRTGESLEMIVGTGLYLAPELNLQNLENGTGLRHNPSTALWASSMTLWQEYSRSFSSRYSVAYTRLKSLAEAAGQKPFYSWAGGRHAELLTTVNLTFDDHIARISAERHEGWRREVGALNRLRERILNGFQWNPAHRSLSQGDSWMRRFRRAVDPEMRRYAAEREVRFQRIRERMVRRTVLRPARSPALQSPDLAPRAAASQSTRCPPSLQRVLSYIRGRFSFHPSPVFWRKSVYWA